MQKIFLTKILNRNKRML